jgi:hypothetical protein
MVKRRDEVEKIRAAASAIRRVLEELELAPGVSERQAAARIYLALYEAGLSPGPILVQFGPNTALPHQEPTDKKLRRGDAVVIDVSAAYQGYFGDLTKSFFYGEAPEEYKAVYAPFGSGRTRGALGPGEPSAPRAGALAGGGIWPPPLRLHEDSWAWRSGSVPGGRRLSRAFPSARRGHVSMGEEMCMYLWN